MESASGLPSNPGGQLELTGMTLTFLISCRYFLSYRQFPRTFPNILNVRLIPSVTASFLA